MNKVGFPETPRRIEPEQVMPGLTSKLLTMLGRKTLIEAQLTPLEYKDEYLGKSVVFERGITDGSGKDWVHTIRLFDEGPAQQYDTTLEYQFCYEAPGVSVVPHATYAVGLTGDIQVASDTSDSVESRPFLSKSSSQYVDRFSKLTVARTYVLEPSLREAVEALRGHYTMFLQD